MQAGIELSFAVHRSTTHLFGSTTKVCRLRFTTSTAAPNKLRAPIHQHVLHLVEAIPVPVKHRQGPGPVGLGRGYVDRVGQPLRVHRDVALDSGQAS